MSGFHLVVLAAIQGFTELLPVSSSAHVILAEHLMGLDPGDPAMTFLLVMLHTGTMLAVVVYFWPRWRRRWSREATGSAAKFLWMTAVATACTGGLGLGLKFGLERFVLTRALGHPQAEVEELFRSLPLIATALLAVGLLIILADALPSGSKVDGMTAYRAVLIGTVQAVALPFRGFSRSGATISTAMLAGIPRDLAEDFSFALALWLTPPVVVLELHRLLRATGGPGVAHGAFAALLWPGVVGMGISFLAGLLALWWLSAWLDQGRWGHFGFYCVAFGAAIWIAHRWALV